MRNLFSRLSVVETQNAALKVNEKSSDATMRDSDEFDFFFSFDSFMESGDRKFANDAGLTNPR